jgi:DNA-nicking Smr family endonuclease
MSFTDDSADAFSPIPSREQLSHHISLMRREFPNLDSEICQLILEDHNYDLSASLSGCRQLEAIELDFQEGPTPLEILQFEFPSIEKDQLLFYLEASGGDIDLARELFGRNSAAPPRPPAPVQVQGQKGGKGRKKEVLAVFPEVPSSEIKRTKGKVKQSKQSTLPIDPNMMGLMELGFSLERCQEALERVGGDPERAANLLLTDVPLTPAQLLQSVFESTAEEDIDEVLAEAENDFERACVLLSERLAAAPPPEDSILAICPNMSITQARALLKQANGDLAHARAMARRLTIGRRPPQRRTAAVRSLWVDLHGESCQTAAQIVRETTRNAKQAGDVAEISFCTGKGLHSKGGVPVLRPLVLKLCRTLGFQACVSGNNAVVTCTITEKQ